MAGRLVEQVNRLIQAGIAGVTEEPRDPAQHLERALLLVRDRLGRTIVERRRLARSLADLAAHVAGLSQKAELAVRKGREDLARAAMAEVANMEQGRAALESDISSLDADIGLLEAAIAQITDQKNMVAATPDDAVRLRGLIMELDRLARAEEDGSAQ